MKPLAVVAFLIPTLIAASAGAQVAPASPSPESPWDARPVDRREGDWRIEAGYRGQYVPTAGYKPFSDNGYLPEFSLAASRTLFSLGRFSFAAGVAWDLGSTGSTVRQVDSTSLMVQRLTATLEGRLHFGRWGYAYLRAAPGGAFEKAEVDDASSPAPLEKSTWVFATDLSAGYAALLWPRDAASVRKARFWLQGEGGYGWVYGQELVLEPALSSGSSVRTASVDLGTLALQGGYCRVAAAVSF